MKAAPPILSQPAWQSVALVCKDCSKRSKGPKGLKGKAVVSALRRALRHSRPRPRIVLTGCLGICPKRALALAMVGGASATRIAHVESLAQVADIVAWSQAPARL